MLLYRGKFRLDNRTLCYLRLAFFALVASLGSTTMLDSPVFLRVRWTSTRFRRT